MQMIGYLSKSQEETIRLGVTLAHRLKKGDIVCLFGDLGSGKTTLTKGIAEGLKVKKRTVHSPTFILMNVYKGRLPLFHFDLYRLDKAEEMFSFGYEDYMYDEGVSVVEWADKLGPLLPREYLRVRLSRKKENERQIEISAQGKRAQEILSQIKL